MDDRSLMLMAYLDGELPADLARRFEERMARDEVLRKEYESMKGLRDHLAADARDHGQAVEARLAFSREKVWDRLAESRARKPSGGFWHRGIMLPAPLLAALALAVVGTAGITMAFQGAGSADAPMAFSAQAPALDAGQLSPVSLPAGATAGSFSMPYKSSGVEITIRVDDLDQILRLLEGARAEKDVLVEMPSQTVFENLGEPLMVRASEQGEQ